ncbi:MAG: class I SAM-dependent methyltransferase [Candidatus Hydrogenedentes bacterium]|nr:class I SAM-dependent methyltransferase [Candidatus Hydrogenedentota bacterium]
MIDLEVFTVSPMQYDHYHAQRPKATKLGTYVARFSKKHTARLLRKFAPSSPPALLEIGPGKGLFAGEFGGLFTYSCLESNALMANVLREEGITVIEGRFPDTALEANSFDAILMEHVFEHFTSVDEQMQVLTACFQSLRPGGVLAIAAPDYAAWGKYFFLLDYTHNVPTCPERTHQMLYDTGFEILREEYSTCGLRGRPITCFLSWLAHFLDTVGATYIAGQGRRMKIVSTLLRSFHLYARKPTGQT